MAEVTARLYLGQPAVTATTLYTVAAAPAFAVVRCIHVANTTATATTITIGTNGVTAATAFYFAVMVPANGALDWTGILHLAATDTLQALQGTAAALTVTVSGITGP